MDLAWEDRPQVDQHLEEFPEEAIPDQAALRSKVSVVILVVEVEVGIGQVVVGIVSSNKEGNRHQEVLLEIDWDDPFG